MKTIKSIDRNLQRHFFKSADARSINRFRLLFCALLAWQLIIDAPSDNQLYAGATWHPIPVFDDLNIGLMPLTALVVVRWVFVTSLFSAALGIFARPAFWVSCISALAYFGTVLGFTKTADSNYVYHMHNLIPFILMILALARHLAIRLRRMAAATLDMAGEIQRFRASET